MMMNDEISWAQARGTLFFPKAPPEMGSRLDFGVQGLGRARGPKFVADGSRRDETLVFEKTHRSRLDETVVRR